MTLTTERRTSTTGDRPVADPDRRSPAGRRRSRLGIVLVTAALGSAAVVTALAIAGGGGDEAPADAPALVAAPGEPATDAPALTGAIAARAIEDPHYLDCMRASSATADGFERRVPTCRALAAQTAACLRELGAPADVAERWIDTCRSRAAGSAG